MLHTFPTLLIAARSVPSLCALLFLTVGLAGCQATKATEPSNQTPQSIQAVIEDVVRADAKLAQAQPLITDPQAKTLVAGARADLAEAKSDGGKASTAAQRDAKTIAQLKDENARLHSTGGLQKLYAMIAAACMVLSAVAGVLAWFLPGQRVKCIGASAIAFACGGFFGALYHWERRISLGILIAVVVMVAASVAWIAWHAWRRYHEQIEEMILAKVKPTEKT